MFVSSDSGQNGRYLRQVRRDPHVLYRRAVESRWAVVHRPVESLWTAMRGDCGARALRRPRARRPRAARPRRPSTASSSAASARRRLPRLARLGRGVLDRSAAAAAAATSAAAAASSRLELVELLLGRQLLALRRDDEPQLGDHVGEDLDRHGVAADPLDRRPSRACGGRRGSSPSSQSRSATFVAVTEPKSVPVGPA